VKDDPISVEVGQEQKKEPKIQKPIEIVPGMKNGFGKYYITLYAVYWV
jgi:hypothetical protein